MFARRPHRILAPLSLAALVAFGACNSDEAPTEPGHTPSSVKLFVDSVEVSANLALAQGATTRVEVRFYDAHGDQITGIEDHHHTALVFTPSTLATTDSVPGYHFFVDVTAQNAAGTGTVMAGYGHDVDADDLTFGPFPVTVP